jgi:hypothetical protein
MTLLLGMVYVYPHPHDPTKFLYVGQQTSVKTNRDRDHRSGRSHFGRRFKKRFPGVELPQPMNEYFEYAAPLELNEWETILMFKYKTWHGYEGGMNITIPGASDYKNIGTLSGKMVKSPEWRVIHAAAMDKLSQNPEWQANNAAAAKKRSQNPEWRAIHAVAMDKRSQNLEWKANNAAAAKKRSQNPEWQANTAAGAKKRSQNPGWRANTAAAMKKLHQNPEWRAKKATGIKRYLHTRWHANRNLVKPNCMFCAI